MESYRGIEQLAARKAHNLEVPGSSPGPATKLAFDRRWKINLVKTIKS